MVTSIQRLFMDLQRLLREKRDDIRAIASKHGAYNVRIFGSVIRGESGPDSDIDLFISPASKARFSETVACNAVSESGFGWGVFEKIKQSRRRRFLLCSPINYFREPKDSRLIP